MKKFAGVWTALIAPFENGGIDWDAMKKIVEMQIEGGVTGILVLGTTGESPCITEEEGVSMVSRLKDWIDGRCLLMAGSGTNCTAKSVEKTKKMTEAGADILLAVNPYYNKPTQEGLYQHFKAMAAATDLPIMLYNIKGRTGVNLETETVVRLAAIDNIVGVKEASGNLDQMKEVIEKTPDDFLVLSGDDALTLELIKMGGDGVISVASNIVPGKLSEMVEYALMGNMDEAGKLNDSMADMFDTLFIETNPIPVKYAAHLMGLCKNEYRLPMCPPSEGAQEKVREMCLNHNLISNEY